MRILSNEEMKNISAGAAITVTSVLAILCAAIAAVVVYKVFISNKGSTTLPGGWKFTWN